MDPPARQMARLEEGQRPFPSDKLRPFRGWKGRMCCGSGSTHRPGWASRMSMAAGHLPPWQLHFLEAQRRGAWVHGPGQDRPLPTTTLDLRHSSLIYQVVMESNQEHGPAWWWWWGMYPAGTDGLKEERGGQGDQLPLLGHWPASGSLPWAAMVGGWAGD
jgi:hypothetical protein